MKVLPEQKTAFKYDYLFAGAGCAGMSLLYHMLKAELLQGKRVLLVDADAKQANDRTWCFWEKEPGPFEAIVHKRWRLLDFYSKDFQRALTIEPYEYKLIRGGDFYEHCKSAFAAIPGIEFRQARIDEVFSGESGTGIRIGSEIIGAGIVFSSLYQKPGPKPGIHWLLQHFKGRLIETEDPRFDPARATLMDFRVEQEEGTSFVYVLPFSDRQALVEFTLFTGALLQPEAYDRELDQYIGNFLEIDDYKVLDEEFGVIPMTNHRFPQRQNRVVYIGTAGGRTKGSSGYTFQNVQRHSAAIVESMQRHGHPFAVPAPGRRFHFYDAVLLEILQKRSLEGADIFTDLFRENDPRTVLRFLDNESSLREDLGIISSLPTIPFAKAALRQLL